ncbi:hypothetical protein GYMLUDRAFT_614472 [Collybiopsis luxurians FD-317 M1]|uniref:Unplaced genomic scaffold GYMLUscaffold_28, whole genome shotgun sequence n=1 Tax=Collybiopsis luxurians FD-317 M1 TaxID=944289 RepID=A0A0D0CNA1_9AGAR|nr:hypothetical protein GYMLUDRAFT_614472 [Collybiopsis luxurians FD-317 M1]
MANTAVAPQMFTGASQFDISNSVFIANAPRLAHDNEIAPQMVSHTPSVSSLSSDGSAPQTTLPFATPNSSRSLVVSSECKSEELPSRLVESEVYARLLLPRKKGYPLWQPKPDEHLPEEYRRVGVRIGDVGILNDSGGFDYLFNACLPADHPVNAGRVPLDFEQLSGMDNTRDITGLAQAYKPGSDILSHPSHIYKAAKSYHPSQRPVPRVPPQVGAGFIFSSSVSKGALLILPEGGSKSDHQQLITFRNYAAEHARSWYAHANGPLARGINNGSIYFVTGCDKARAWGVASFTDACPSDVSLEFVPSEPGRRGGPPGYWFSKCKAASSSSDADDVFENQSGCIFLRGFKVAVRIPPFTTVVESIVTNTSDLETDDLLPKPKSTGFSIPPIPKWWLIPYLIPRVPSSAVSRKHALLADDTNHGTNLVYSIRYPARLSLKYLCNLLQLRAELSQFWRVEISSLQCN